MYQKLTDRIRRDESGFTLVELLVVIVILGILAAIVVFSVRGITDKGQDVGLQDRRQHADHAPKRPTSPRTACGPPTETALMTAGFITTESKYYNIRPRPAASRTTRTTIDTARCRLADRTASPAGHVAQ